MVDLPWTRFVGGLRYTDKETAEIVQMVLAGKVNKGLVSLLTQHGGNAIGLCGIDGDKMCIRDRDKVCQHCRADDEAEPARGPGDL